jgi:hypothetical protein
VQLVTAAIADEKAVRSYCSEVRRRHRSLRAPLRPLEERQEQIVAALTDAVSNLPPVRAPRTGRVATRPEVAVRDLTRLVSAAQEDRLDDCLAATSGLLARLFASTSASHAVSVEQLRAVP